MGRNKVDTIKIKTRRQWNTCWSSMNNYTIFKETLIVCIAGTGIKLISNTETKLLDLDENKDDFLRDLPEVNDFKLKGNYVTDKMATEKVKLFLVKFVSGCNIICTSKEDLIDQMEIMNRKLNRK